MLLLRVKSFKVSDEKTVFVNYSFAAPPSRMEERG